MLGKADYLRLLGLTAHIEGGYFRRSHASGQSLDTGRAGRRRPLATSIYYMLTDDSPVGYFHRNRSDILHYFHAGSALRYQLISPAGELTRVCLGPDLAAGQQLQLVVPGGYWKATQLTAGEFGLLSEAVAPGFDYRDMEIATPARMKTLFPLLWPEIAPWVKPE